MVCNISSIGQISGEIVPHLGVGGCRYRMNMNGGEDSVCYGPRCGVFENFLS